MGIYSEKVTAELARITRSVLAADSDLLAFFGAEGIRLCDYEDLEGQIVPPLLAVVPGLEEHVRQMESTVEGMLPIHLFVYLPRATPTNPAITTPSAPSVAQGATGALTGAYRYRVTATTDEGESFASDASSLLTVTGKRITVTVPTISGAMGRRLWRTEAGRIAYRFLDVIPDNTTTSYTDNLADAYLGDELAPVQLSARNLMDHLRSVLWVGETLHDAGVDHADATLVFRNKADRIIPRRNLRQIVTTAQYGTLYSSVDASVLTERVGG